MNVALDEITRQQLNDELAGVISLMAASILWSGAGTPPPWTRSAPDRTYVRRRWRDREQFTTPPAGLLVWDGREGGRRGVSMISTRQLRLSLPRILAVAALTVSVLGGTPEAAQAISKAPSCQSMQVPVTVPEASDTTLYGELCVPAMGTPSTVQLLVHGGTYTHAYWDWPLDPDRYSYVRRAVAAGYATFNVDHLGSGQSSHPPSDQITFEHGATALHEVIGQLRNGAIGGRAFPHVIWVGHSFGSIYAWVEASMYQDVDAFVLTGLVHSIKPSWETLAFADLYPAELDPKFAASGLDFGYLTTVPGTRGSLYYDTENADPRVIAGDEGLKDTITLTEIGQLDSLISPPSPDTAPSRVIVVPTLLVVGGRDNIACGAPDGLDCTVATVASQEAPYYSPRAHLQVAVVPRTGHDLQLHLGSQQTDNLILDWLQDA
jgi:Alpha/beta hydrolase family